MQTAGEDYGETFAPLIKLVSLRILLTLAAINDMDLQHWDVVAAFLNGELEEEVYMKVPPGFESTFPEQSVLRLNKSIYGLCQSARAFYLYLDKLLRQINWKRLHAEWAIWIALDKKGFIGCHVDDMLFGGPPALATFVRNHLSSALQITDLGNATIYVGINIIRDRLSHTLCIDQTTYIDELMEIFKMDNCNPVGTPIAESDRE